MQKTIIILLVVASLGLGAAYMVQRQRTHQTSERAAAAERALLEEKQAREAQESQLHELQASRKRLDEQVQQFTKVTTTLRDKDAKQSSNLTALAQSLQKAGVAGTNGESKGGLFGKDMGNMLQTMMKDPAMRDMIKSQQKVMISQMYGGLFKDLNLTPDAKEKLSAILADSQMRNVEAAQGMFGKDAGADAAKDLQKLTEDAKQQTDSDVRALLGDDGFAKYQDYQKTMGERMQLDQLKTNFEAANIPLQGTQSAQLLQIMQEEKASFPPVIPTDNSQVTKNLQELMTQDKIDQQLHWMEEYNSRVARRAKEVLTPDQFKQYQEFQTQQANMQKLGLKMAREMFGGSANEKQ
jgi:hypothetical protein